MTVILFEDEQVAQLDPVALGRPAFAISCGSYRLVDLVATLGQPIRASVRPHLRELVRHDFPGISADDGELTAPLLMINARLVPSVAAIGELAALVKAGRFGVVRQGNSTVAALLELPPRGQAIVAPASPPDPATLAGETLTANLPLFEYPHDVIRHHLTIFEPNLRHRLSQGAYKELQPGVFVAPGASIGQYVVTDASRGPIVLEEGASVGPYCYLSGPAHLGPAARVLEHAALKDGVALGHTTKIGGEVEASIIEPYTNKQHHGFLGHSYLGSWVNLGAGTCNSDLKNTYGTVNMEYHGRKVATGMQFVGAVIGDYAKTAINTGIFTGKTIGACSMVYGFVTTNVPSFVNYARLFGQVTEAPVEVMIATQKRMFARREVAQRPCDIQLLRDMYDLTAHERHLPGEQLSLEPLSL